jgi:hypothetical protein
MVLISSILRAYRTLLPGRSLALMSVNARRIGYVEKSSDLFVNRTYDLPDCSIFPQPTTLQCSPGITRWGRVM